MTTNDPKLHECRPGGCQAIGCERGHYCFNADGTPRSTKLHQEGLVKALAELQAAIIDSKE